MYIKNEVYLPASIIEMNSIELELTSGEKYVWSKRLHSMTIWQVVDYVSWTVWTM